MIRILLAAMSFTAIAFASASGEVILYENGVFGAANVENGLGPPISIRETLRIADNFTLTTDVLITGIEWTGIPRDLQTENEFRIEFYGNADPGIPEAPPIATFLIGNDVTINDSGFNIPGPLDILEYYAEIPSLRLPRNNTYWLSISNPVFGSAHTNWFWAAKESGNIDRAYSRDSGQTWTVTNPEIDRLLVDFRILGVVVPEPSHLSFGCFIFAAAWARRVRPTKGGH